MPSYIVEIPGQGKFKVDSPNELTDAQAYYAATTMSAPEPEEGRTLGGTLKDVGITALKGAVGLPQSIVGLADIPTLGQASKLLEQAGYRPAEAQKILEQEFSPAQQEAMKAVSQAEGFLPTLKEAIKHPSVPLEMLGESLPQMIGGGFAARWLRAAAPALSEITAAGIGEGLLGAGSAAQQIRAETPEGDLSPKQSLAALLSGVGTAAFGVAGGKLAKKLNLDDIDTMIVHGGPEAALATDAKRGFFRSVIGSGISEGVFEELPQSVQEQMWQNWATDKPLTEGVGQAAALGTLVGSVAGGIGGAYGHITRPEAPPTLTPPPEPLKIDPERYKGLISAIQAEIPEGGIYDPARLTDIAKSAGLESDEEAKAYIQEAVNQKELQEHGSQTFKVEDKDKNTIFQSPSREVAEKAAANLNAQSPGSATVVSDTATKITRYTGRPAGTEVLPGLYNSDRFNIISSGERNPQPLTVDEAAEKVGRLNDRRKEAIDDIGKQAETLRKQAQSNTAALESMEAQGLTNTPEYEDLRQETIAKNNEIDEQISALDDRLSKMEQPISVVPAKASDDGFTVMENDKPLYYFPTEEEANEVLDQAPEPISKPTERAIEAKEALRQNLLPFLQQVGLGNTGLRIMDAIDSGEGTGDGYYSSNLISVALDAPDPMGTVRHEVIHALKEMGAFTEQEWKVLENAAHKYWIDRFLKNRRTRDGRSLYEAYQAIYQKDHGNLSGFDEYITEEAVADAFKFFHDQGIPPGILGRIYKKIRDLLQAIGNAFRGLGFQTANDVFERVEGGQMHPTKAVPEGGKGRYSVISLEGKRGDIFDQDKDTADAWKAIGKYYLSQPVADRFSTRSRDESEREILRKYLTKKDVLDAKRIQGGIKPNGSSEESYAGIQYINNILNERSNGSWLKEWKDLTFKKPSEMKRAIEFYGDVIDDNRTKGQKAQDVMESNRKRIEFANKTTEELEEMAHQFALNASYSDEIEAYQEAEAEGTLLSQEDLDKIKNNSYDNAYSKELDRLKKLQSSITPKVKYNLRFEDSGDKRPFDMKGVRVYEKEIEGLVKKIGNRIAGMQSDQTLDDVRNAVNKLKDYTQQGLAGHEWYERSAKAVIEAFNGDKVLAEKFFQLIAITSQNTEVAANFTKAYKGWTQFAEGKPIKVGTENENKKISDLLYFGLEWEGRKTNTFYLNLMEAMEGVDTGKSTIDLHMARMIFDRDAPTDAQYELAENMVRLLATKVKVPPRQVQAASWVTQKAKTLFENFRKKNQHKKLDDRQLRELCFERALVDYAHLMDRKKGAPPVTAELREPSEEIRARTETITGEVIPSVKTEMVQVSEMKYAAKAELNKKIFKDKLVEQIADELNLKSKIRISEGTGGYKKNISPNLIVRVINPDPEVAKKDARDLSDAMSYVFKQDASPYFRADPKLLNVGQVGFLISFDRDKLTITQQKKLFKLLQDELGEEAGFSKTQNNELLLINYRGEDGKPFLMDDDSFNEAMQRFATKAQNVADVADVKIFGAESEYRDYDWSKQQTGKTLVDGLQAARGESPNLSEGLDSIRKSFVNSAREAVRASGAEPRFSLREDQERIKARINIDGVMRPTRNSMGTLIAPTEDGIRNFWKWFGNSVMLDDKGYPLVLYHGTARDFEKFNPKQAGAVFVTPNLEFAEEFAIQESESWMIEHFDQLLSKEEIEDAKRETLEEMDYLAKKEYRLKQSSSPYEFMDVYEWQQAVKNRLPSRANIIPLYVKLENPFDFQNKQQVNEVVDELFGNKDIFRFSKATPNVVDKNYDKASIRNLLSKGDWGTIEHPDLIKVFNRLGFDGFSIKERYANKNYGVFDPEGVKSVVGNLGSFGQRPLTEEELARESKMEGVKITPEEAAARQKEGAIRYSLRQQAINTMGQAYYDRVNQTTYAREEEGFGKKISAALSPTGFEKFRQLYLNKYQSVERLSRTVANTFGQSELYADQSAIAAALMSDRASGITAEALLNGVPVYEKGFTKVSNLNGKVKGLMEILRPLMEKYKDPFIYQEFQFYGGTRRGRRLLQEGREKNFTPQDIAYGQQLETKYPEFKQAFEEFQRWNEGFVKFLIDTGVISKEMGDHWMKYADYLPFYRQLDGEKVQGPQIFQNLSGIRPTPALEGGGKIGDFLETVIQNARAAVEQGMKNVAAQRIVRDVMRLNSAGQIQAQILPPGAAVTPDVVTVRENGKDVHYRVADPLLVNSMKSLHNMGIGAFWQMLSYPTKALRELVTKDPAFMIANMMRDSVSAWVTSGISMTPVIDTYKQFGNILLDKSPTAKALKSAGIGTGYEFAGDVKASAKAVAAAIAEKSGVRTTAGKAMWPLKKIWDALESGSNASDLATRAEIYDRVMKETGGNEAEAIYQALEVMNFGRMGNSPMIQVISAIVPFFNARIQGLDVLYRAGFGKLASVNSKAQHKAFITRAATLVALSLMYLAMARDTDEWKRANKETRDNYWIIGDVKIPIPFEIGVLFKVMPERLAEYMFGQDTGEDLAESMARNIVSTLKINPIPQAVLPAFEASINYSMFTGEPIVGRGMENVAPQYQLSSSTSLIAQKLGEALGVSPMKLDHVLQGYTGSIGMYTASMLDAVIRTQDDVPTPSMRIDQIPILKRFIASDLSGGTLDEFYRFKHQVEEVVRTQHELEMRGDPDKYIEYMEKNGHLLAAKSIVSGIDKELTNLRKMRNMISFSKLTPDDKREALDNIRKAEIAMTEQIKSVRKTLVESVK
jgi:hypothetical protein